MINQNQVRGGWATALFTEAGNLAMCRATEWLF